MTPQTPPTPAAPATKKCSACKAEIHFYRAVIGGKRYGDCKCERARTWIMDVSGVRFVNHNGTQHDVGCSCSYRELHGGNIKTCPVCGEGRHPGTCIDAAEVNPAKAKRNARVAKKGGLR